MPKVQWCYENTSKESQNLANILDDKGKQSVIADLWAPAQPPPLGLVSLGRRLTDRESDIPLTGKPRASISLQSPESFRSKVLRGSSAFQLLKRLNKRLFSHWALRKVSHLHSSRNPGDCSTHVQSKVKVSSCRRCEVTEIKT
ncbi:hypothetical protein Q8A67_023081 [Cirrhinus molitorella]|uniref:Uncharacterized protein n=1 Tax=Cirrhinus molitorella TaxID=172907 RepID=A0AA88TFU7_9TELE|nr:hypothetical protein Q8A67_023081 [Cirrhinus molitorella]